MTILFQDYYDVDGDLSTLGPAVGGAYALFWSDTNPTSYLTDFEVSDATGGLEAPTLIPGPTPAVQFVVPMDDVVGPNFSVELQFGIEKLVNDDHYASVRLSLFESADLGSTDFGTGFPHLTMQTNQNSSFNHTVSAYNRSSAGDLVVFCTQDGAGYGPVFHPTGGIQTMRLEVTPAETVFLLDDVVVGRRAAEVSQLLDTIYVYIYASAAANRRLFVRQLQVATGADVGRFWTNRVRTAEVVA